MISTMRPDIDNMDEYVRNTTARAFAVVASALGIPSLLPFLKVCPARVLDMHRLAACIYHSSPHDVLLLLRPTVFCIHSSAPTHPFPDGDRPFVSRKSLGKLGTRVSR